MKYMMFVVAIEIASRHPQARGGKLELRPFWTDE